MKNSNMSLKRCNTSSNSNVFKTNISFSDISICISINSEVYKTKDMFPYSAKSYVFPLTVKYIKRKTCFPIQRSHCFSGPSLICFNCPSPVFLSGSSKTVSSFVFLQMSILKFKYYFMCLTDFNKSFLTRSVQ